MTYLNCDRGLSEVIGFVLILALIIMAISIWMTYGIPVQGRDKEISHMENVNQWFINYKIASDSLWINSESGITDSTSLTLGSQGGNIQSSGVFLPLLQPIGSSGTLSTSNTDTLTISTNNQGTLSFPMSALAYQSNNNYWIPQTYYYQMGGVFLAQNTGGTLGVTNLVSPLISIYNVSNSGVSNSPKVVVVPIRLNGGGTVSGQGRARVDFRLQDQPDYSVPSNSVSWVNIAVNVSDTQTAIMWRNLFRDIVNRENIPKSWYPDYQNPGNQNPGYYSQGSRSFAYINITSLNGVILVVNRADFFTTLSTIG